MVRPGPGPPALPAGGRPGGERRLRAGRPPGQGSRARHHGAAGDGPRERLRRAGQGAPHARALRLHALDLRVPAHPGLRHLGRRRDAPAGRHAAAADAGRLGRGDGVALPGAAGLGRRRVRRARRRRPAFLRAGDRHHGPRVGLPQPSPGPSPGGPGMQHPSLQGSAAPGQTSGCILHLFGLFGGYVAFMQVAGCRAGVLGEGSAGWGRAGRRGLLLYRYSAAR